MKQTISFTQFLAAFNAVNRTEQFTYAGLRALYDWLEQMDEDCGTETELDVISLCCEFSEYEDLKEFHRNYDEEDYPDIDTIRDHTQVIEIDDESFIIQDFYFISRADIIEQKFTAQR